MEHPALKNLYKEVISGKFNWERWGLLGVLADHVLYFNPGDMLEIGCGESSIYFSKLAEKHNRKCYHCEFSKSGVENMKNTQGYFGKNSEVHNVTSDEFFKTVKVTPLILSFIDGDHEYEQVKKDFDNVFRRTLKGGYIFLHDTKPPNDSWKVPEKCGTVYILRQELEQWADCFTFERSAFDVGLTMVRKVNGSSI